MALFHDSEPEILELEQGELLLVPALYSEAQQQELFKELHAELLWRQDELKLGQRSIPIPRLQAWYGDPDASYAYSGLKLKPATWTKVLLDIKSDCEQIAGQPFNSVLANLYRDGNDSVSWHADDEKELGKYPVIASVSLGETRTFQLKHKKNKSLPTQKIDLPGGSLLIMRGETQHFWKHQIAKTKIPKGPRINLTFRLIKH